MIRHMFFSLFGLIAFCSSAAAGVTFTTPPTAAKSPDGVKISFAVSEPTDVAVYVESVDGKIVRHLAAGVVGPGRNSPPFAADSLTQTLVWDGKADYGKDASQPGAAVPQFKVRVALGLGAKFDKVLISDPQAVTGVSALAVGPDGTLFVTMGAGGTGPVWSGQIMLAFDRNGKYLRQVMPFPADLTPEQAAGFDLIDLNGRPAPVVHDIQARSFYGASVPRKAGMAVTPEGVLLTMLPPCNLGALDGKGAAVWGKYVGPGLQPKVKRPRLTGRPFVAVAPDGKHAYVSGLVDQRLNAKGSPEPLVANAVYRVKLPDRSPAEPLFGDPATAGSDDSHLGGAPRGLAADGKGHLLIADYANDRIVVVNEADGKFIKAITIEASAAPAGKTDPKKPRASDKASGVDCLAADPRSGAIYATRLLGGGDIELVKLKGIDEPKVLARLAVPRAGNPDFPWLLAVDATGEKPVCWLGGDGPGNLLRIEDDGEAFAKPVNLGGKPTIGNGSFVDLSIDRVRGEVYTRCGLGPYWWFRINDATDEIKKITLEGVPQAAGSNMVPGPDGTLYSPAYPYYLLRFDRDGKAKPWTISESYPQSRPGQGDKKFDVKRIDHGRYAPVSMTFLTHTLGVRNDGHIFLFQPANPGNRPPKMLIEYDAEGKRISEYPIIWKVSDTAVGPKFDPQGNIYIAEQIKPLDQPCPPEFDKIVGKVTPAKSYLEGLADSVCSMYGGIIKFSPKGGMVHFDGENPWGPGEPRLDPSLPTIEAGSYRGHRLYPTKVTGALWIRPGISHVDLIACNCENTRFDVDEFGRVFYPDMGRFRVGVLDTNGNPITEFGEYGNGDAIDRIAFSWLIGVAASDRHVYMGDSLNRRLLRAKLVYATEATCEVK